MNKHFPKFTAVRTKNGSVGFFGPVRGRRTGREYIVTVKVPAQGYPEKEPALYIHPRIGLGHWQYDEVNHNPEGRVNFARPWVPMRSTFANCVLVAIQYLEEFDQ